ncbi:MAG: c-type cytochrome domain-containing protein, partial [Isosphaeraceae bacterium]
MPRISNVLHQIRPFALQPRALLAFMLCLCFVSKLNAAELEGIDLFEKSIRPVLVQSCYSCHSAEAVKAGKLKGGLLLDSRQGMLAGGESGPALVPGKAKQSLILEALRYETYEMP